MCGSLAKCGLLPTVLFPGAKNHVLPKVFKWIQSRIGSQRILSSLIMILEVVGYKNINAILVCSISRVEFSHGDTRTGETWKSWDLSVNFLDLFGGCRVFTMEPNLGAGYRIEGGGMGELISLLVLGCTLTLQELCIRDWVNIMKAIVLGSGDISRHFTHSVWLLWFAIAVKDIDVISFHIILFSVPTNM